VIAVRTLLSALLVLLALPLGANPQETRKALRDHANWLAIQTAEDATYDGQRLTLHKTNGSVVLFTDRPYRTAESMSNKRFISAWDKGGKHSFAKEPPNAAVSMTVDGKVSSAVVVLSEPRLQGTDVSYSVRVLEGSLPRDGKAVSLFIDDVCLSCW
jgi:hypothetical protein